jgi:hypothetical protein
MDEKHKKRDSTPQEQGFGNHLLSILRKHQGRLLAICFLVYLIALVRVGNSGGWNFERGFEWSIPGYQLFPIPINWYDFGFGFAQVVVPMPITDIIIYTIFVGFYFWVFWGVLAIAYLFHPSIFTKAKSGVLEVLNRSP